MKKNKKNNKNNKNKIKDKNFKKNNKNKIEETAEQKPINNNDNNTKNKKKFSKITRNFNLKEFTILLFNVLMFFLFFITTYNSIFNNNRSIIQIKPIYLILGCLIYISFFFLIHKIINRYIKSTKVYYIILFLILLISQIVFVAIFRIIPNGEWDFGNVYKCAIEQIYGINSLNNSRYLIIYPNNVGISIILTIVFGFFKVIGIHNYEIIGIILNIAIIDVAVLFLIKTIKLIFNEKQTQFFSFLTIIYIPFITYSPIYYTDTFALPFVSMALYFIAKIIKGDDDLKNIILAGFIIGLGINLKMTVIINLVAFIIYFILSEKIKIKKILIILVAALVPIFALKLYINMKFDSKELNRYSYPLTHWVMMGLEDWGGYSQKAVDYTDSFKTKELKTKNNIKQIKKHINEYSKNHKLLDFYINKAVYTWGDGQYYVAQQLERGQKYNYSIKNYVLESASGNNKYFKSISQIQHIVVLMFILCGLLFRKYLSPQLKKIQLFSNISIFGIFLFLMIWEARSRYIFHFLPIILLASYIGMFATYNWLKQIDVKKIKRKFNRIEKRVFSLNIGWAFKTAKIIFIVMFSIILLLLLFFSNGNYYLKRNFIISNIFVLIPIIILIVLFTKFIKEKDISENKYKKILICLFILIGILQIIIIVNAYFYTDWDVKVIRDLVTKYLKTNSLRDEYYLSIYPNNILLTAILIGINKIPFIGSNYFTVLFFNAILVNIAGVLTCFTLKNIHSKKAGLISYALMTPLILLSPWIIIPYTDTMGLFFTSIIIYLYSRKEKKIYDYFFISFFAIIGYYIKPTVVIILMAIIIIEILSNYNKINVRYLKKNFKIYTVFLIGVIIAFCINSSAKYIINFKPVSYVEPFTFVHYLAMGQNNKTLGTYSEKDINDTATLGKKNDIKKFKDRLTNRNVNEQINFFKNKTLLNFNDGSFCWGLDGSFFYKKNNNNNNLAKFLKSIYYADGKYYNNYIQVVHYIWLIVLFLTPWIVQKKNKKEEYVIMISIIGITLFLTIFEPRTRYLYCYSELFVICAILGLYNIKNILSNLKKKNKL